MTRGQPQTLRPQGLGRPRSYGGRQPPLQDADLAVLRRIQDLTNEGLNLAGVQRVLELEAELVSLHREIERLRTEVAAAVAATHRQYRRDVVPLRQALVRVTPPPRNRST